jgi:hypothetical protein
MHIYYDPTPRKPKDLKKLTSLPGFSAAVASQKHF